MNELLEIETRISYLKKKLKMLWEVKGKADPEILGIAEEIDQLLNRYDYYMRNNIKAG